MAFILLAVHWYNPLVWICFKLLTVDIELACDERVVKNYTLEKRKSYAEALLSCAVNEGRGLIYPLGFGEVIIKDRIKSVVEMLSSVGADAEETPDGIIIRGGETLVGGMVNGYNDHRIVMSASILSNL